MRVTARTGTVGAGAVLQTTRAFTSCALRNLSSDAWTGAFTRMPWSRVVHLLRNEIDFRALDQLPAAGDDLHRKAHADIRRALGGNVDVGFQLGVLIHGGQQRLRRNVVADVHRNVAHDAGERSGQVVIGKLALLGNARRLSKIPSPPWNSRRPARPDRSSACWSRLPGTACAAAPVQCWL